jgi:Phage head-tail joining protein
MNKPNHLYIHTASIVHHHFVMNKGDTENMDQPVVSVNCRIQPLSGEDSIRAGGDRTKFMARMYCDPATDIRNEDHVLFQGRTYRDLRVRDVDFWSVYKVVDMTEDIVERP